MNSGDNAFVFDSQAKFQASDFFHFNTESRLDVKKTETFIRKFTEKFDLYLYGVDVIITKDGRHLVIDCNYFSSYRGLGVQLLSKQFDSLFEETKAKSERAGSYQTSVMVGLGLCAAVLLGAYLYKKRRC